MQFAKNDQIKLKDRTLIVKEFLGDGGQGEVYLVEDDNGQYAFKLYKDKVDPAFKENLENNIAKGAPDNNFLWPKATAELEGDRFGYLMDLRPKNYASFDAYVNGKTPFKNLTTKIHWCIELCKSFKKLHEKGLSYQDLNDGSFFLDPNTGDILICDNDNVAPYETNLGVLGKMRYMAPEIVRGEKMPDTHSDRFSLAVILFMTLCIANPFEGERLKNYDIVDEKSEYEMYGKNPVFVYHKTDLSNRPIRGYHNTLLKYWPRLPIYIKEAFHKTFVDGLVDRENGRTTEIEWLKCLCQYRDEVLTCVNCGQEYPMGLSPNEKHKNFTCPICGAKTKDILVMQLGKSFLALDLGKTIYETHLDKYSSEYNKPIAKVISNPKRPEIWGIRLNGTGDCTIKDSAGTEKEIADGGVIPMIRNLKVKFNKNEITGEMK